MRTTVAFALCSALCLVPACKGSSMMPADLGPVDMTPPPIPAADNARPESDPRGPGQRLFFFETWGTELTHEWPPTAFMLSLMTSEPEVFGNQFGAFGFQPDPGDDLPIGFKRGTKDPTIVHETCAMCHVGRLPDGRLWIGAPNATLDIGRFQNEVSARWVAAGNPPLIGANEAAKNLVLGPGRTDAESVDYPTAVPADFPPYFTLGQRTRLNYLGTGSNVHTEACFAIYTFGAGSPNDDTAVVPFPTEEHLQTFLDFFGAIDPPAAPAGDAAAIARGQTVFSSARCDSCHHVGELAKDDVTPIATDGVERIPGDDPMWPRGSIATDPAHRALVDDASSMSDAGFVDLLHFIGTHMLRVTDSDGYRVNDLRSLWATAPYLHNGSVPTLEALFSPPADRPKTFSRGTFTEDASVSGCGNGGHAFGTELSADDKTALIAYLRSL